MKKHLLCAGTFLAFSFAAFAGALNTTGVPASAEGVLHIDFEAASKSQVGQILKNSVELALWEDSTNPLAFTVPFWKNASDITAAGIQNSKRKNGVPEFLAILRGNFSKKEFLAHTEKLKLKSITIGKRTFFEIPNSSYAFTLNEKRQLQKKEIPNPPYLVCQFDANTIVVASNKKIATDAIAALSGETKSYAAPASLKAYGKRVGTPFVLLYLNEKVFPKRDPAQPKNAMDMTPPSPSHVFFALGEDAKNVKARLAATYATAADVQKTQALAQMAIEMARGGLANPNGRDGKPDPKKAEECAKMTKVLNALKIATGEPNYFTLSLDYPAEEIVQYFKDINARENAASSKK
jgi:hypothetical protein